MAAAGAALRLRLLYRMLRVGELLALVAFLSWSSSRVPSAAAAVLRFAGSLLLNARFVFVLGNAIVLLLLALSRHDLSASSSSGQQTSAVATTTTAAAPPPQDAAPAAASASFASSFTSTPITPLPPAAALEAFSSPPAPAMEVASAAPAEAGTAFEDRPPAASASAVARVSKLARAPRRSRSEKMGSRVLQLRRAASPPAPEMRRSESENGRRRSSVSTRDARGYCWGADDADEFRRTVEAFIDKHKRFHRQESMTMAVVAGSGAGHCEAAPAFTGALAVVE